MKVSRMAWRNLWRNRRRTSVTLAATSFGLLMMVLAYWFAVRYDYPVEEVFHLGHLWYTFKDAAWAFLLPIIILGGIFGGLVTATEGAGLAVVAALFICRLPSVVHHNDGPESRAKYRLRSPGQACDSQECAGTIRRVPSAAATRRTGSSGSP